MKSEDNETRLSARGGTHDPFGAVRRAFSRRAHLRLGEPAAAAHSSLRRRRRALGIVGGRNVGASPWMNALCLPRALAAHAMLRRRGIASRLCLGVARERGRAGAMPGSKSARQDRRRRRGRLLHAHSARLSRTPYADERDCRTAAVRRDRRSRGAISNASRTRSVSTAPIDRTYGRATRRSCSCADAHDA